MRVEVIQGKPVESGKVVYCTDCGIISKRHAVVRIYSFTKIWSLCALCFSKLIQLSSEAAKELM